MKRFLAFFNHTNRFARNTFFGGFDTVQEFVDTIKAVMESDKPYVKISNHADICDFRGGNCVLGLDAPFEWAIELLDTASGNHAVKRCTISELGHLTRTYSMTLETWQAYDWADFYKLEEFIPPVIKTLEVPPIPEVPQFLYVPTGQPTLKERIDAMVSRDRELVGLQADISRIKPPADPIAEAKRTGNFAPVQRWNSEWSLKNEKTKHVNGDVIGFEIANLDEGSELHALWLMPNGLKSSTMVYSFPKEPVMRDVNPFSRETDFTYFHLVVRDEQVAVKRHYRNGKYYFQPVSHADVVEAMTEEQKMTMKENHLFPADLRGVFIFMLGYTHVLRKQNGLPEMELGEVIQPARAFHQLEAMSAHEPFDHMLITAYPNHKQVEVSWFCATEKPFSVYLRNDRDRPTPARHTLEKVIPTKHVHIGVFNDGNGAFYLSEVTNSNWAKTMLLEPEDPFKCEPIPLKVENVLNGSLQEEARQKPTPPELRIEAEVGSPNFKPKGWLERIIGWRLGTSSSEERP